MVRRITVLYANRLLLHWLQSYFIDSFNTPAAYGMAVRRTLGLGPGIDLFNIPADYGMAVRRTLLMHHWLNQFLDLIHGFRGALSKEGCRNMPIGLQWAISDCLDRPLSNFKINQPILTMQFCINSHDYSDFAILCSTDR